MTKYIAEAFGTAMLILFGDGVVANVLLARSKGENSGWIVITLGLGIAVMVAVYTVGRLSGAHLNPAVTVALASVGAFPWTSVPGYIAAQTVGAIVGAGLVWAMYFPHWAVTQDADLKLAVFCTGPAIRRPLANFLTETIATAAFVFGLLGIGADAQTLAKPGDINLSVVFSSGLQPLLVGALVLGVGLSFGGPTGYAINPARDLGPRIAHSILPIPGKRDSDWGYAWVPIAGPLVGGIIGAQLFNLLGF
ncbi:MAG TPA: MIP/aquaporin family protein [Vicinamibacterales bacterium]